MTIEEIRAQLIEGGADETLLDELIALAQKPEEPITLEEAKAYMRVEYDTDDELITNFIAAARHWVEVYIRKSLLYPTIEEDWKQALLVIVSYWYQNRESGTVPSGAKEILYPYREMRF